MATKRRLKNADEAMMGPKPSFGVHNPIPDDLKERERLEHDHLEFVKNGSNKFQKVHISQKWVKKCPTWSNMGQNKSKMVKNGQKNPNW